MCCTHMQVRCLWKMSEGFQKSLGVGRERRDSVQWWVQWFQRNISDFREKFTQIKICASDLTIPGLNQMATTLNRTPALSRWGWGTCWKSYHSGLHKNEGEFHKKCSTTYLAWNHLFWRTAWTFAFPLAGYRDWGRRSFWMVGHRRLATKPQVPTLSP